jgi:hypothetical protein
MIVITVFVYYMSLSTEKQRLIGIQKKEITMGSFKLTNDVLSLTTVCFDYTMKSTLHILDQEAVRNIVKNSYCQWCLCCIMI